MSHYSLLSERRFPLHGRIYFPDAAPSVIPATVQWQDVIHSSSAFVLDTSSEHTAFQSTWSLPSATQATTWSACAADQHPFRQATEQLTQDFSSSSNYPESSHRTILPPSPTLLPSHPQQLASPYPKDLPRSPSHSTDFDRRSRSSETCSFSELEKVSSSSSSAVKAEPDDSDCFIMELADPEASLKSQSLAPPTEVPLRATQANQDMKKMMGVFRLNPFTIHKGAGRGTLPSIFQEPGPLEAEPLIFEFQIELDDHAELDTDDLRPFSPEFELDESSTEIVTEKSDWVEDATELVYPTSSWDADYSTSECVVAQDSLPTENSSHHYVQSDPALSSQFHRPKGLWRDEQLPETTMSVTSQTNSMIHYDAHHSHHQAYQNQSFHSNHTHTRQFRQLYPSDTSWDHHGGYVRSPQGTTYPDSPQCDVAGLPADAAMNRRWSLPDSSVNAPFLM